jgi:hypothetical protein
VAKFTETFARQGLIAVKEKDLDNAKIFFIRYGKIIFIA